MCDPVSIAIAAGTALAKGVMENRAQSQVGKATLASQRRFNQDMDERRNLSNVQFQDSISQSGIEKDKGRYDQAVAERTAANAPQFDQRILLPGQGGASGAVKASIVQAQDKAIGRNNRAATTDARLGAYGDSALGRNIMLNQNAQRIGTQGGFAQGALNNLSADMAAAQTAGNKSRMMADIIGAIGTIGGAAYGPMSGATSGYDVSTGITWNQPRTFGGIA